MLREIAFTRDVGTCFADSYSQIVRQNMNRTGHQMTGRTARNAAAMLNLTCYMTEVRYSG